MSAQTTSSIIMVRPAAFGYNIETAANNTFQHVPDVSQDELQAGAVKEFDDLVSLLRQEGVSVMVVEDTTLPFTPDAIFPNNWISFHEKGTVITYPMFSALRRQERREDILEELASSFLVDKRIGMEDFEQNLQYLEGTGSMVLDRANKIAYACISPRTDKDVLNHWCEIMGYSPFSFRAILHGKDIYHTNVMMSIGDGIAVVCLEVVDLFHQKLLLEKLQNSGHEVVQLRPAQVDSFAGNMLAIRNNKGEQLMVMSRSAFESLDQDQKESIQRHARIVSSDVHTIETVGGGSVRCMIAENFLPHI